SSKEEQPPVVADSTDEGGNLLLAVRMLQLDDADIQYNDEPGATAIHFAGKALRLNELAINPAESTYQLETLTLSGSSIRFDNNNQPRQAAGVDYAHLNS